MKEFDAVIIGSGMGGGAAAYALARAGLRTLLVERSEIDPESMRVQDELRMLFQKEAADHRVVDVNGKQDAPLTGSLPGGSSSVYGAVTLRPSPRDFEPGADYGDRLERSRWEWPIDYATLEPFFDEAENLFQVSGDYRETFPHLGRRSTPFPSESPELEMINHRIRDGLRSEGVDPFRLPLAIDFDTCERCPVCPGYYCPTGARGSSWNRAILPAKSDHGLEVWLGMEAERLRFRGRRATSIVLRHRSNGEVVEVAADRFLVGAGAIGSPTLLQASDLPDSSGALGRYFMFHLGSVAVATYGDDIEAGRRFRKRLGWSDAYFGADGADHKLGFVQSIPIPGIRTLQVKAPFPIPGWLARWTYNRSMAFAMVVEDLPRRANRIERVGDGIRIRHQFDPYDLFRGSIGANYLRRCLKASNPLAVTTHVGAFDDLHTAHQVGTTVFGSDPKTSVLNPNCRAHGADNVYGVDGGFMPTSLGVGPALTIAANSLRVAKLIAEGSI